MSIYRLKNDVVGVGIESVQVLGEDGLCPPWVMEWHSIFNPPKAHDDSKKVARIAGYECY